MQQLEPFESWGEARPPLPPSRRMSEIESEAVRFGKLVLLVMAMVILGIGGALACSELGHGPVELRITVQALERAERVYAQAPTPEQRASIGELARQVQSLRQSARQVWLDLSQLVLVNILLPVLTSVIGYAFGSMRAQERRD